MIKKPGRRKKATKSNDALESSALAKTLQEFASQKNQNKDSAHLWLDKEVYAEAQREFGRKVSAIVEAALRDILAKRKEQKKKDETDGEEKDGGD